MVTVRALAADEPSVWWVWVLGGVVVWAMIAVVFGLVVGRALRVADQRAVRAQVIDDRVPAGTRAAARQRRQTIPIPPIGLALLAVAVLLETVGFLTRLSGSTGQVARLLSMDAPYSVPRMYVAALFAAAAVAAAAGAGNNANRRTWWLAVALVAGGISAVKAGSTVHAQALHALQDAVGNRFALLISAATAAAVVGGLWFLSRTERRDRRRVLGVLALYGVAAVGLAAVSSAFAEAFGRASTWATTATFLEESGEALAGVGFLVAVLVGVAPRLVLPASWALRRADDAHSLALPESVTQPVATELPAPR